MLISRTLARKRIRAENRPSLKGAWLPVFFDILLIMLVLAVIFQPALFIVYYLKLSLIWLVLFFFVFFFVPAQLVIIVSTIWAVRSRWEEKT